ncbi:hypothetical protein GCM10023206_06960 [Acinetobacter puyangensis]|uniref:Uncharacterized protein n=1 Tax=Acinetobacter puyangensis TaxID=1096779 RepID=A0A240E637_9GAMM|nr:hypothetical protein [Acinetobacter puyangensis]SNX44224.1 hypothetical protein SAMN05421731_102385 [Acinetobacter puyangensis]
MSKNPKIETAFYLDNWTYENGDIKDLIDNSIHIKANEFELSMKGNIFCPSCKTPLSRVPTDGNILTNNRNAFFRHLPRFKDVKCSLRTPEGNGKKYSNEEQAKKAINDGELIIISKFISEPVENNSTDKTKPYDFEFIEDEEGEITGIPISRHQGEKLNLPTRIMSIQALCVNFDKKLHAYIYFPNMQKALTLKDTLINIQELDEPRMREMAQDIDQIPSLFYGKIKISKFLRNANDDYIRMTFLEKHDSIIHFSLKIKSKLQDRRGIREGGCSGRFVLFWGTIKESGVGFSVSPSWGEFGLLSEKYNKFLCDINE